MCGISCIISNKNQPINRQQLESMTDIIRHRGPDGFGYYFGPNFAFGHRRLAILDLSEAGHQPMEYRDTYIITFNGEVYNYLEIREELEKEGFSFRSTTDTEVILGAYAKWGEDCINHFNGMWAFAIYDKAKKRIFCSRDRFGVKPLYYCSVGDYFAIASEIKQFSVIEGWKARLNLKRAYDFLVWGAYDHSDETLFQNVYQLVGGNNLIYNLENNSYKINKWYNLEAVRRDDKITLPEATNSFRELLPDSVKIRLRSDVKIGSCLSGGLDSSSIVCIMNELLRESSSRDKQETVSACYSIGKYDEQNYINAVIQKTGAVSHRVFPNFEELQRVLDNIIFHHDEPFGSTSAFAQWEVFKNARKNNIIVMLDGQGADEILAGYHSFYSPFFIGFLKSFRFTRFFEEVSSCKELHRFSNRDITMMIKQNVIPLSVERYLRILLNKPQHSWLELSNKEGDRLFEKHYHSIYEFSLSQILRTCLPAILHCEDRNSMAHSVESRVPFLDYRLIEFILKLPDEFKIKDGITKYVMREALKPILPATIYKRYDKMGFVTPENVWLREHHNWVLKELKETVGRSHRIVNDNAITMYLNTFNSNKSFDFTIWRIIAFGRWLKIFDVTIDQ